MVDEASICHHIRETIGAVLGDVVHIKLMTFPTATVVIQLFMFGTRECHQMLDGACDGSSGCSCSVSQAIVAMAMLAVVLMPVEDFFCNFMGTLQVGSAVFIMVLDP